MSKPSFTFTIPAPAEERPRRRHGGGFATKALWVVGLGLLANAAVMLYTHVTGRAPDLVLDRAALAQMTPATPGGAGGTMLGARGIYMMPAQLGPTAFGVYLLDVDSQTICVYRALPDTSHFRLMAARSFQHDRFLQDFNNEPLRPKEVQKLVQDQRQRLELQLRGDQPSVPQTPPKDENLPDGAPVTGDNGGTTAPPLPARDPQ
jgi:hypothetical protein